LQGLGRVTGMNTYFRLSQIFSPLVVVAIVLGVSAFGQESKPDKNGKSAATKKNEGPKFVRIDREGKEPRALQVAIASYEITDGPNKGTTIDLIGAVHVGTKQYYSDLNNRFRNYDSVLYELVADPEVNNPAQRDEAGFNPIGGLQVGMKTALELSFQLDEVDYSPKNFVHADMSPSEFGEDMKKRNDGFVAMFARMMGAGMVQQASKKGQQQQADLMAAFLAKDPIKMRRAMAEQFESMEGQLAGLADKDGKSTLLTERNRKAFEVLEKEIAKGKKKISVFYGAAHLLDMDQRLQRDFGAQPVKTEWVDAWPLR
jgi:hypothetical protein